MSLAELYETYLTDPTSKELLKQTHWFASFADFDPKTGEALPTSLTRLLSKITNRTPEPFVRDRLWHLVTHSLESATRLMTSLSEEPRRESAYLPIRDVRELDTASFIALSRRPGRNIREKLADKPYMQAVKHFQSIDVPENRLLKAYLLRLTEVLELRKRYLHDTSEDLDVFLQRIYRWLNQDETKGISRWENLAPNNTLLSHRDYRRVWNSWRLLQSIDDDIDRDRRSLARRRHLKNEWEHLAKRYSDERTVFADMPVHLDYNNFDIIPWDSSLPTDVARRRINKTYTYVTSDPVCIDLTQINPVFATIGKSGKLDDSFFWQRWKISGESSDIELFESDGIYLHPDATTVTCSDMFFFRGEIPEELNRAARAFALRAREHFRNGRLIWLTPDCLNDFELELARRNINAVFSQADPLPCSVAAVFKHINYSMISRDGFKVAVIENINGNSYITELTARYDDELIEQIPETLGYLWEKGATDVFKSDIGVDDTRGPLPMLSQTGEWFDKYNPYGVKHNGAEDVIMDFEGYDCVIWLNTRPVEGGIRLYQLQKANRSVPLWRNKIPELMTKVRINGVYQPFYLVGKGVTVKPIRGRAVLIDVPEEFTLPAGQKSYRLPLLQGAKEDALEYEAKLISKDMPYSEDIPCRLEMTYTYGVDDPYRLIFRPLDATYKPINVIWQLKEDVEITDAPGPAYPPAISWADLQHHYNPKRNEYSNLLDWALDSSKKLLSILKEMDESPLCGKMTSDWRFDKNGKRFTFVETASGFDLFMHENSLVKGVDPGNISAGDYVFYIEETFKGKRRVKAAAPSKEELLNKNKFRLMQRATKYIHQAMYVPYIQIWADGKSLTNEDCPQVFRSGIIAEADKLSNYLTTDTIDKYVRNELVFLFCCMSNDMPSAARDYIFRLIEDRKISENSFGYALGDVSSDWQKKALRVLLEQNNGYALRVLSRAIWRSESLIECLSIDDINSIIGTLQNKVSKNTRKLIADKDKSKRKWTVMNMTRYLELLLGLLRLRDTQDRDRSGILQPNTEQSKFFATELEKLIQNNAEHNDNYFSRIQLDTTQKPEDDTTPDLLYALRVYLTGDDAANAIRITGIVEDED